LGDVMMRAICFSLIICLAMTAPTAAWTPILTADHVLGENRIVALCNGSWQLHHIDMDSLVERDIAMIEIKEGFATFVTKDKDGRAYLTPIAEAESLIRRAACTKDTEFVLIGKDTGVKQRWSRTLPEGDLFQTIDAMPMRQYEIRTRGRN